MSQLHPRPLVKFRKPIQDESYKNWIRSQPCLTCKQSEYPIEAAHTKQEGQGGMSTKTDDSSCIPLCPPCHRVGWKPFSYHGMGSEETWATHHKLDLAAIKADLRARYVRFKGKA